MNSKAIREGLKREIPLGHFGSVEDMGSVAAFLCSDDAGYISGETVVASGGMRSRL